MSTSSIRFSIAGLDVVVTSAQPDGIGKVAGFYSQYPPTSRSPALELTIETIPGFATQRARGPEYPGFHRRLVRPGVIALERFDAEGWIRLPLQLDDTALDTKHDKIPVVQPVRGQFQIGESVNTLEAVIRIGVSIALPRHGGLLMHASAIAVRDRAHIFAGVSGAGKSTISAMLAATDDGFTKLSDELLIVAPERPGEHLSPPAVHVTPFIGSRGLPHGTSTPIAAVYFLNQAPDHRREPMTRTDGLRELLRHVLVYVAEPETAESVLDVASRLVQCVPCHRLHFAKDPGVASVLAVT